MKEPGEPQLNARCVPRSDPGPERKRPLLGQLVKFGWGVGDGDVCQC